MSAIYIEYRQKNTFLILSVILSLIILPFFLWPFLSGDAIFYESVLVTRFVLGFGMAVFFSSGTYSLVVFFLNFGKFSKIVICDGIITFKAHPHHRNYTEIAIRDIHSAWVGKMPRAAILVLRFKCGNMDYAIPDANFSEKEFSKICNSIVKVSDRCKACQSAQVTWKKDLGHCHNCETISPRESEKFDWSSAYQA